MNFLLYEPGDIVLIKNLTFKDEHSHDLRIHGRPSLIIHTNEENFYFLTISKNKSYIDHPLKYYELYRDSINRLTIDKSYINLQNIYKDVNRSLVPLGSIRENQFDSLLKKLVLYQLDVKKDELFDELIDMNVLPSLTLKISSSRKSD